MPEVSAGGHRIRLSTRLVVGIVVAAFALLFIAQNTRRTEVHILFWHADRAEWLWLLILFAAGFVAGSLFPWLHRPSKRDQAAPPPSE